MKPKQRKTRCQNEPSRVNDVVNDQRSRSIVFVIVASPLGANGTWTEQNETLLSQRRGDVNVAVVAVEFMSPQPRCHRRSQWGEQNVVIYSVVRQGELGWGGRCGEGKGDRHTDAVSLMFLLCFVTALYFALSLFLCLTLFGLILSTVCCFVLNTLTKIICRKVYRPKMSSYVCITKVSKSTKEFSKISSRI